MLKDIPYEQNEAAAWGDTVHKLIEKFFETGDFPETLAPYRDMILGVAAIRGERLIEQNLAVDKDWQPCKYKSPDAYFRGKVDLTLVRNDGSIVVVDWKTGNSKYGDGGQGGRYAAMLFSHYPEVHTIRTRFIYFKDGKVARGEFSRERLFDLADGVDSVARTIEISAVSDTWPKKSGPLCKRYCGVLDCEYNGRKP
jgi:hypothetical protein